MSPSLVTLTTDFGLADPFVGIMKGVLLGINPSLQIVDLCHNVEPQDILGGAIVLEQAYRFFPPGTVHLAVVDPGVGGPRRPIIVEAAGQRFVGPDNGLFSFLYASGPAAVYAITREEHFLRPLSRTFHARDLFAPVAAHLSLGKSPAEFGPRLSDPVVGRWPVARPLEGGGFEGEVISVDRFGNLMTNLTEAHVGEVGGGSPDAVEIEILGRRIRGLKGAYGEGGPDEVGALVGSTGRLELFRKGGSARQALGAVRGEPVRLLPGRG